MNSFICQCHLGFLSDNQKAELSKYFRMTPTNVMPHQLAVHLGIKYSHALAVLADLEDQGVCEMKLLIYHNCKPSAPVGAIPYGTGFPDLPWTCPHCENIVENYDKLSFEIMAMAKQQIESA
jgi:hypothetical protein